MGILYRWIVVLILFEGIVTQCECSPPKEVIDEGSSSFADGLIRLILNNTDPRTIRKAASLGLILAEGINLSETLEKLIVWIVPGNFCGRTHIENIFNDLFLEFGDIELLESFFEKFGDQVRRVRINYGTHTDLSRHISKKIIRVHARFFHELRITFRDEGFWSQLSVARKHVIFRNVTKFEYIGKSERNNFKLNEIFPNLESVTLLGKITDQNCFENVTKLIELELDRFDLIQEDQLASIFANNRNIRKLSLTKINQSGTMWAIATYLQLLETLILKYPGENFLLQTKNEAIAQLPSVQNFRIEYNGEEEIDRYLPFKMPNLIRLSLSVETFNYKIFEFIEQHRALESVELIFWEWLIDQRRYNNFITQFGNIKEFTVKRIDQHNLSQLFENFDEGSTLQTLKFLEMDDDEYRDLKNIQMKGINERLREAGKSTWTLSHGKQIDTGADCVIFQRQYKFIQVL